MPPESSPAGEKAGSRQDDDLMSLIAAGDQQAARQLVERHLPSLKSLALHMLGSEAEAEEIAQDAFFKLWQHADKWQPRRALISTWLRRVASNNCIDRLRQRRTRPLMELDEPSIAPRQQLDLEEKHLKASVNAALDELPERQRLALTLCHYQGMSQRSAAHEMDISEHALESLLARAKRGLKTALASEWQQLLPDRRDEEDRNAAEHLARVKR